MLMWKYQVMRERGGGACRSGKNEQKDMVVRTNEKADEAKRVANL